ncbi:hypothetical protein [Arthrobacter sp. UYEF36]
MATSASTMAALRKRSQVPRDFGVGQLPVPVPGAGQVLVRSMAVGRRA